MSNPETSDERSWAEYRKLVINELERIDKGLGTLNTKLDGALNSRDDKLDAALALRDQAIRKLEITVAMLKIQCGMWGGAAGLATAVGSYLLKTH